MGVFGRLFIAVGGLVVLVLFAALLAPLFVDWTGFRENFEAEASRILGKKVVVNGAVEARILPFPSVTLKDVTVGPGEDGQTLVHVASFSMDAELAPFLSGETRIFSMRVEKPEVRLRLLANGSLDWLRGSRPSLPAGTVVLEKATVTDGDVTFIDEQTGRTRHISGLNADLSARSLAGPWSVSGRAALDGQAGTFTLSSLQPEAGSTSVPVKIRISPDSEPVDIDLAGDLALQNGRPTLKGSFVSVLKAVAEHGDRPQPGDKPVPQPRVKGKFELANDRIRVPEYRLEIGAADNPYVITGEATLDTGKAPEFLLTADGQQIDVDKLAANVPKGKTGRIGESSARQRIRALIALADDIPIPTVPGRASLKLPAIVAGDTVIRDVTLDLRPDGEGWQVDKAVALLPGRTQVEASGHLRLKGDASFSGSLLAASNQPSGLAGWLSGDVDPALRQLKTAGFSAEVQLTEDEQRFEKLELAMGTASLKGRLERQAKDGAEPALSFDLTGNEFDYDTARALASLVAGDASTEALLRHQVAGQIKVGAFSVAGLTARDVNGLFTYKDGGFSLRKLEIGDLAGASLTANGEASGSLADYNGKAQVILHAGDVSGFLAMLNRQVPDYPLLAKIASHGRWYGETDLVLDARFGDAQYGGVKLDLHGKANGTEISANLSRNSLFDPMDDAEKTAHVAFRNEEPATLLGQLGLDPLPLPVDGPASLTVDLAQRGSDPATGKANVSVASTALDVEGRVTLSKDRFGDGQAHVSLKSEDIEPLLVMNALSLPGFGQGLPLSLSADVERQSGTLVLSQIQGNVDGNAVAGQLNLERGDNPRLDGALTLQTASLDWLASTVLGPLTAADGGLMREKLHVPIWGNAELALVVDAKSLDMGELPPASDAKLRFSVVDGGVQMESLTGQWLGGTLEGQMSLSNTQQTGFLRGKATVKQVDLARLWQTGRLSGKGDLDLTLEGSGPTVADLLSSVNGSGKAMVSPLVVAGLDLSAYDALQKAFAGETGEIAASRVAQMLPSLLAKAPARLEKVELPLTVTQGTIRFQGVHLAAPPGELRADGTVGLADGDVDAALTIAYPPGEDAPQGSAPELTLSLTGPVAAPVLTYGVEALANDLSARALERERRRVETLQANVLEKQRLRREAAYYAALAASRQAERARQEAERRAAAEKAGNDNAPPVTAPPAPERPADQPMLDMRSLPGGN
ncbi:uncharacterized protein involved in outer membrane biogenesis [Rhizobium paknamense]|uniref:Uncharacterized protein involved in outer membrane biogenesis n=1 Tax=Rhizobium paknamense TaxID=1206817 RepID=A0ABU0IC20_9HYPH|nr:uncharacterized protein involved in outer membrane biogenesis [Rhizobium paknamense]